MKSSIIYRCGDRIVVVPKGRAPSGRIVGRADMDLLKDSSCSVELKNSLQRALDRFDDSISASVYDTKRFSAVLSKLMGRESYASFVKSASAVEVGVSADRVVLQPYKSSNSFKGLESYQNITEHLPLTALQDGTAAKRIMSLLEEIQNSYV